MMNPIAKKLMLAGLLTAAGLWAQAPQTQKASKARIAFEVASIKPAATPGRGPAICLGNCSPGERLTLQGARVDIRYMPISDLLIRAYRVKPYQVSSPAWIRDRRFDIAAKIPEGVSADRLPEMLQTLLADRFKLTFHREAKVQPVYALVVGKNGIKLKPSEPDADNLPPAGPKALQMYTPDGDAHMENGRITITSGEFGPARSAPGGKWEFLKMTMPALAAFLTVHEDHPVIDETTLPGAYRLAYEITMQEGGEEGGRGGNLNGPPARDAVRASILEAIENGGLKLERRNAPIETIVIDSVEKMPTEN